MIPSIENVRKDFPILSRKINDKPLVYLDNAATTLKPKVVIEAITNYYSNETANVHRGIHSLSTICTEKYEGARKKVQAFINAETEKEIVFTSGTTESINLVALSYAKKYLKKGDRIVCSELEHHSNLVPWQMLAKEKELDLVFISLLEDGSLDYQKASELINNKTKLVVFNYVSNSLGTINDIDVLINLAKKVGAKTCVDAAQAVLHFSIDVQKMDCDFLSFSSHKLLGPTGFGVLYAKKDLLLQMEPIFGGGDMIEEVHLSHSTWNDIPFRFEAGTPHIAGAIGLSTAIDYVNALGFSFIQEQEISLFKYANEKLKEIPDLLLFGYAKNKVPVFSFTVKGLHGSDIATILDQEGVAVRSGHHCTMPVLEKYGVTSLARASFSFYNTKEEVDRLVEGIKKAIDFLG